MTSTALAVGDTLYVSLGRVHREQPWVRVKVLRITKTFIETEGLSEERSFKWAIGSRSLDDPRASFKEWGRGDSFYGNFAYRGGYWDDEAPDSVTPEELRAQQVAASEQAKQAEEARRAAIMAERGVRGLILDTLERETSRAAISLSGLRRNLEGESLEEFHKEVERLLAETFYQLVNMRGRVKSVAEGLTSLAERGW